MFDGMMPDPKPTDVPESTNCFHLSATYTAAGKLICNVCEQELNITFAPAVPFSTTAASPNERIRIRLIETTAQLSAALNELKAKDTELAAKEARIAELAAQELIQELVDALRGLRNFCDTYVRWVDVQPLIDSADAAIARAERKEGEAKHV